MKRLFLLDAYALIYRAYYAFVRAPRINSKGLNTSAVFGFLNTLEDLLKREHPTHLAVVFDPSGPTFRHEAFEQYKANRQETPEDIRRAVPIIKELVKAYRIPVIEVPGFEADDVIATLALKAEKVGYDVFMMTPDKDYGQLVSDHVFIYKPRFGASGFDTLGVEEVKVKFDIDSPHQVIDLLGLMGDQADNIPGCPGVGEKTAAKLLKAYGSIENLLEHTDELKGALKTKIETHAEQIKFSRFLATIKCDVPVELHEEELVMEEPNKAELITLFTELEFRGHLKKLQEGDAPATRSSAKRAAASAQPSLFDEPAAAGAVSSEPDLFSMPSQFANISSTEHHYETVQGDEAIAALVATLMAEKSVCFDTETTSVDALTAQLVGISFSINPHQAWYVPVPADANEAAKVLQPFIPLFESEEIEKVGQNMKYDILVLENYDIAVKGPLFDTMIAHYLINPELRHGMDYLAETMLSYQTIHIDTLIGARGKGQRSMRDVAIELITDYAAEDADITLQLKLLLATQLKEQGLESLFHDIEMPLMRVLAQMERNGMAIAVEELRSTSVELNEKLNKIEEQIREVSGMEVNISSPKQIGILLFEELKIMDKPKKTKTGQYVTDEETLEALRSKHPVVGMILEYRGLKKLLSTYIDALPKLIDPKTGKIHTSFNQTVTATGRLSSSNPNLQNIPIRDEMGKEIRRAFVADKDCLFLSADYSQVELRIMAHLSGDERMIAAFQSGEDIHAATAANIYHVPIAEVTSDMRRKAKTANFGIIYGISVFGLSERLNIPRGEAKELIDGYFASFPKVKSYMEDCIEVAKEKGYVETLFHRKRFLPDINSHNANVRGYAERNAINAPIQGTAADIIKIAMVRIAQRLQKEGLESKMILQVHDELNFNVPVMELDTLKEIVRQEMEHAITLQVPLQVDMGVGHNWLEAH